MISDRKGKLGSVELAGLSHQGWDSNMLPEKCSVSLRLQVLEGAQITCKKASCLEFVPSQALTGNCSVSRRLPCSDRTTADHDPEARRAAGTAPVRSGSASSVGVTRRAALPPVRPPGLRLDHARPIACCAESDTTKIMHLAWTGKVHLFFSAVLQKIHTRASSNI